MKWDGLLMEFLCLLQKSQMISVSGGLSMFHSQKLLEKGASMQKRHYRMEMLLTK